jgi:hypothetical protein
MIILCENPRCPREASVIIVAGCLNGHISDMIGCQYHYEEWEKQPSPCTCGQPTADHLATRINGLPANAILRLATRPQQAKPPAIKPYDINIPPNQHPIHTPLRNNLKP